MELTMTHMHVRERALTRAALVVLTLFAWVYLILVGSPDSGDISMEMHGHMPAAPDGNLAMLLMNILMWSVMMIAMMLPSASPMILTYGKVHRQRAVAGRSTVPTWLFVAGYFTVWTGLSVIAALIQWGLHENALLSSAMGKIGPLLAGGLLVTAGTFQFSRLKEACLSKCRSPLSFLMTEWREGNAGAFIMGIRHGAYCTGCCWALMLLIFVGGVMSLVWMAALAVYFLAEKLLLPRPRQLSRATGALLIGAGVVVPLMLL